MDVVIFLEQLAGMVHYDVRIPELIQKQSDAVQQAFATNNRRLLDAQISHIKSIADNIMVAEA